MSMKLYVGNLAYSTLDDSLCTLFEQAGTVVSCEVVLDRFTKKSRGFAFVEMASREEAEQAVEQLNDYELDGRRLVVNVARPREPRISGDFPGGGGGGFGGKRKTGKGSRRGSRSAKRDKKACW